MGMIIKILEIRDRYILRVDPDMEFHASCLKVYSYIFLLLF